MDKTIFRREQEGSKPPETGSLNSIFSRRRRDTTPLISAFNEHEKSRLIKNLFKRDSVRFYSFMLELNSKMTWPDAYSFIEAELKKRNIDIVSHEAKELTDKTFLIFYPEDHPSGW